MMGGRREQGAIERLCKEIGEPFDRRLERSEMLLAFVGELVREVGEMVAITIALSSVTGKQVSQAAAAALPIAQMMCARQNIPEAKRLAEQVHDISFAAGEEVADRPLEMLTACASAICFGLELPCRSRHAAAAAAQIWGQKYGVKLSDQHSPDWQQQWARVVFHTALATAALAGWNAERPST